VHRKFGGLKQLYDDGDAAFLSNIGSLVEPLTKEQYYKGGAAKCVGLFSHNDQRNAAQTLQCQVAGVSPMGNGGRLGDALAQQGYKTTSFSISSGSTWAQGKDTHVLGISATQGARRMYDFDALEATMMNITARAHSNIYADEYQRVFRLSLMESEDLGRYLDEIEMPDYPSDNFKEDGCKLCFKFQQAARIIKTRGSRQAERDLFYINYNGFDMHNEVLEAIGKRWEEMDTAISGFVAEMKRQGVWDKVAIVSSSDFARTLTSNGKGTDHGWAANHFVIGGDIQGGKVYNDWPASLAIGNDADCGRGRLIPKYPWENVMVPLARWMGLDPSDPARTDYVFPNLKKFNDTHIISASQLFKSA
jgi:uncharacterized protein (DUF1501 family)